MLRSAAVILAVAIAAWLPLGAVADTAREAAIAREAAQREALETGMRAVVEAINAGSYARFAQAIDRDDMLDRIFGLRLIAPRAPM